MSTDRLEYLRDYNKYLLEMLKQHKQKLDLLRISDENHEKRSPDEDLITVTFGDLRPTKAPLARSSVKLAATSGTQRNETQCYTKHGLSKPSEIYNHVKISAENRQKNIPDHIRADGKNPVKDQCNFKRDTNKSDECDDFSASGGHHLQPLLGYDWIAGLLETEESLVDRTDDFFSDLHKFRSFHKNECVHNNKLSKISELLPPFPEENEDLEVNKEPHQCTFTYRINSRLFPVPLHPHEACVVCKRKKSSHPHTITEPALVRVSLPCVNLMPCYKYKPHRRSSFDPSDSLGLPSHCLSNWPSKVQVTIPRTSTLDLRSSLKVKKPELEKLQELSAPKTSEDQLMDWISDLPRLNRLKFQHFTKRKLVGTSQPFTDRKSL